MVEKFSDYESVGFLSEEGDFEFEIKNAELKDSKNGEPMVVFECESDHGKTTIYHSLNPKARWSYNNLIKACLKLDTKEKINNFELDYQTVHNQLLGKKFLGHVEAETYIKPVKIPLDDGTFEDSEEEKTSYKIKHYEISK